MTGPEPFGALDGQRVRLFHVAAETAIGEVSLAVMERGATLVRCLVPDAAGRAIDIALGHDTAEEYIRGETYVGAIAGRYGNRIRGAAFELDGTTHRLPPNEGANQLHGGPVGFDRALWRGEAVEGRPALRFRHVSPDGDMGFPGRLEIEVEFAIVPEGGFTVEMLATSDRPTLCNPVQHGYWNLAGHASGPVTGHVAQFFADFYTPVDDELLATGEIRSVAGTPFDFREPKPIGRDIAALEAGGRAGYAGGGYDHNLVLRGTGPLRDVCRIHAPASGLGLKLATTEPGVQFYTGGYLGPDVVGKGGAPYGRYGGFTLETQKFPGSAEFAHFPSPRLDPGETYRHAMRFLFYHA